MAWLRSAVGDGASLEGVKCGEAYSTHISLFEVLIDKAGVGNTMSCTGWIIINMIVIIVTGNTPDHLDLPAYMEVMSYFSSKFEGKCDTGQRFLPIAYDGWDTFFCGAAITTCWFIATFEIVDACELISLLDRSYYTNLLLSFKFGYS